MTKAKWVHKECRSRWPYTGVLCGSTVCFAKNINYLWSKVTCPKCLTKKSKKPQTNLFFELDGKVFITEKTKKGKVVSQEEIDGETVLKLLVSVLEQSLREKLNENHYS